LLLRAARGAICRRVDRGTRYSSTFYLSSDNELLDRHGKAYQIAVDGKWSDRISLGDAYALFLAVTIQARAIQTGLDKDY